jgi:hypothetical protein
MTDLVITATSVLPGANCHHRTCVAGVAVTAGQVLYKEAASGKLKLLDNDSAAAEVRTFYGIALHGAAANQPVVVHKKGQITIGATVAAGVPYFTSVNGGGIAPVADLAAGQYITFLGWGISATVIDVQPVYAGVVR